VVWLGPVTALTAQDFEVFSEPNKAKGINEPVGVCICGMVGACGGSGF